MTVKTKIVFIIIMGLAVVIVAGILAVENFAGYALPSRGGFAANIQVAVAPSLEVWVREAADQFNDQHSQIVVRVVSLRGLDAEQRLSRRDEADLIDAWVAEADFIREMADNIPFDQTGPSVAVTRLTWLAKNDYAGLSGQLDWPTVHAAAVDTTHWQRLSGSDQFMRAALPSPSNSVEGLAAYISAAASFQSQADLRQATVTDQPFLDWMDEVFVAVNERNRAPLDQFIRPPVSVDLGMLLENELQELNMGQFIQQPPQYNVIFDYPYLIRRDEGVENAANRVNAAEQFRQFLLSGPQQARLAEFGFAQAGTDFAGGVQIDGDTAETLWNRVK